MWIIDHECDPADTFHAKNNSFGFKIPNTQWSRNIPLGVLALPYVQQRLTLMFDRN